MLTKIQWQEKIYKDYFDIHHMELPILDHLTWWNKGKGMHLSSDGFFRFNQVKIEFHKFVIDYSTTWNGLIILGLARMPSPYYCDHYPKNHSELYIVEQEYAVLLKMLDSDLETFAKEFLKKNEIIQ
jgi:hypothetical protein